MLLLLAVLLGCGAACSTKRTALAELAQADGPVEREADGAPWSHAPIGTRFFVGDAARTAEGAASLVVPGGARLAMQPHTVLRFGGKAAGRGMVVETGAVDISGEGRYALDVGEVTVSRGGTVRVAARGAGQRAIELKVGAAQISTEGGGQIELQVGRAVELQVGAVVVTVTRDAALADAAPTLQAAATDAGIDAGIGAGIDAGVLGRAGTNDVAAAIPTRFDLRVPAGETLTVHDPRPPTAVQLVFGDRCPEGGVIELARDRRFRTPRVSAGKDAANVRVDPGAWAYRLRCTTGSGAGAPVAAGRIAVLRDAGTRALPKARPPNDIDADGRTWRLSYQSVIPDLRVHARTVAPPFRLHLQQRGGKGAVIEATASPVVIPGASLREGTYTYWIGAGGAVQGKVSTLIINFDQTAAQVYIEAPEDGAAWGGDLDVRGAVLPGWTASVDTVAIPIDRQRRFAARVGAPPGGTLVIKLAHPERGIHYYLRRAK